MRDEEYDEWKYEKEYPSEFKEDCKLLLRRSLIALNQLPDTLIEGTRGLTSHMIAQQIKELLND